MISPPHSRPAAGGRARNVVQVHIHVLFCGSRRVSPDQGRLCPARRRGGADAVFRSGPSLLHVYQRRYASWRPRVRTWRRQVRRHVRDACAVRPKAHCASGGGTRHRASPQRSGHAGVEPRGAARSAAPDKLRAGYRKDDTVQYGRTGSSGGSTAKLVEADPVGGRAAGERRPPGSQGHARVWPFMCPQAIRDGLYFVRPVGNSGCQPAVVGIDAQRTRRERECEEEEVALGERRSRGREGEGCGG